MRKKLVATLSALLAIALAGGAHAGVVSYQGSLADADGVFLLEYTLASPSALKIQGYGYGGGTNGSGATISAGGFDTVISLFRGSGASARLLDFNDDGTCPPATFDPVTGGCLDSALGFDLLLPDVYTIAVSVSFNMPVGPNLGAGYTGGGSFIDVYGDARTQNYAFDVTVQPLQVVSEPSSLALLLAASLAAASTARGARTRIRTRVASV